MEGGLVKTRPLRPLEAARAFGMMFGGSIALTAAAAASIAAVARAVLSLRRPPAPALLGTAAAALYARRIERALPNPLPGLTHRTLSTSELAALWQLPRARSKLARIPRMPLRRRRRVVRGADGDPALPDGAAHAAWDQAACRSKPNVTANHPVPGEPTLT
jgi:hypothetical protein